METKKLVANTANFPGSFASDLRRKELESDDVVLGGVGGGAREDGLDGFKAYFTDGWDDINIWKSAFIEFVGTTLLCYLSAMIHTVIGSFHTLHAAAYVGVSNIAVITLFIYALAPASGGHVNPLITFTTITTGLTGFSRGVLYLTGQTAGGALAGGLIRGSFGSNLTQVYQGGGCLFDSEVISDGQAYLIESVLSFCLIFIAFGVGLDPRQGQVFGPKLGPFLTACDLGLVSFASVGLAEGYPGPGLNPARCFSTSVARADFRHQWIWWVGPFTGGLVQTAVYRFAPPYHREKEMKSDSSNP